METDWEGLADKELVDVALEFDAQITKLLEARQAIDSILIRRLEERGAKELPHPKGVVKVVRDPGRWDDSKLAALRELLPPEVVKEGYVEPVLACDLPPDYVVKRGRWDMRKVNAWARKFGDEIKEVVEGARMWGPPRLVVKPK